MKKFIRFVVILLTVVIAAVVILGLYEPQDKTITRTTFIKAPKEAVFEQIVKYKNWPNWSPWYKMDSGKLTMTYYGTDGQPGSGYAWEGDKTGAGDMRDSAINGTHMMYKLTFTKPREGTAWGNLNADDSAGGTKVTWTCNMHFPFPINAMCIFMDMDKLLGGDFESGLKNMKAYLEAHSSVTASEPTISEVDYPGHLYEGMRKVLSMANPADMNKFFAESYAVLGKDISGKINGPSAGIYFTWDTVKKESDMAAVFPVSDTTMQVKGAVFVALPASKAVMAVMKGGYGKEMDTHIAIAKYMSAKGEAHGLVLEEYITGPATEPDSNKWVTNIYYMLK